MIHESGFGPIDDVIDDEVSISMIKTMTGWMMIVTC
jgi:hypothetical protein